MAILTGIGFTMSLFIGTLAFDDEAVLKQVRLGVLAASLLVRHRRRADVFHHREIERNFSFAMTKTPGETLTGA